MLADFPLHAESLLEDPDSRVMSHLRTQSQGTSGLHVRSPRDPGTPRSLLSVHIVAVLVRLEMYFVHSAAKQFYFTFGICCWAVFVFSLFLLRSVLDKISLNSMDIIRFVFGLRLVRSDRTPLMFSASVDPRRSVL